MIEKKWASLRTSVKELLFLCAMCQSRGLNRVLAPFQVLLREDSGSKVSTESTISAIGAIGGAVVGGLIGAKAEEIVMGNNASEFIIQPDIGEPFTFVQVNEEKLKAGERVLIINSDKIRIVRDQAATK